MEDKEVLQFIEDIPDEVLQRLQFSFPWQYGEQGKEEDADGFSTANKEEHVWDREQLQTLCWKKFLQNPWINTAVRGSAGRTIGMGFEVTSEIEEIQNKIDEVYFDPRNRFYDVLKKYVIKSILSGELALCLTVHKDGFIEVDYIDPKDINGAWDDGILYHPTKATFPLFFNVNLRSGSDVNSVVHPVQIPSINIARFPSMFQAVKGDGSLNEEMLKSSKEDGISEFGGFNRFIVYWNRGCLTRRASSHLRTVIEWVNHYELLKMYEIDHKRSSGSYLWTFTMEDMKTYKKWLSLTEEEKAKSGIGAKKTPGSTLVLPPGFKVEVVNPKLNTISEQDTDILQMVTSGLNEESGVTTGSSKGTFASVKASRGPMSDRTSDEIFEFDMFFRYDFWASVFFLSSKMGKMKDFYEVEEAYKFVKKEPKYKMVKKKPEFLIDVNYPVSEILDFETRARGLMGVKHGPVSETLGIPVSEVSKKLGFGSYGRNRLRYATEENRYPDRVYALDAESLQEKVEAEPGKKQETGTEKKKPLVKKMESSSKEKPSK